MIATQMQHDEFRVSEAFFAPGARVPCSFRIDAEELLRLVIHLEEGLCRFTPATRSLVLYAVQPDRLKLLGRALLAERRRDALLAEPRLFNAGVTATAMNISYREGFDAIPLLVPARDAFELCRRSVEVRLEARRRRGGVELQVRFVPDVDPVRRAAAVAEGVGCHA